MHRCPRLRKPVFAGGLPPIQAARRKDAACSINDIQGIGYDMPNGFSKLCQNVAINIGMAWRGFRLLTPGADAVMRR
jgi:hypothetical protein